MKRLILLPLFLFVISCGSMSDISPIIIDESENIKATVGEEIDQQQIYGGDFYAFGHHDYEDNDRSNARQSFIPQVENLNKLSLGLYKKSSHSFPYYDPCNDPEHEKFSVKIKDSSGTTFAEANYLEICDLPTRGAYDAAGDNWRGFEIRFDAELIPGETYWISITYHGIMQITDTNYNMGWLRSVNDGYPEGISETVFGTSNNDFTFKTWTATGGEICEEEIRCNPTGTAIIRIYPGGDCDADPEVIEECGHNASCEANTCMSTLPVMTIEDFDILRNGSFTEERRFGIGDEIQFRLITKNYGADGTYAASYHLEKDGSGIGSDGIIYDIGTGIETDVVWWPDSNTFILEESGLYSASVTIDNCSPPNICHTEEEFTVSLPCTDADGDSYYINCEPFDCDDENSNAFETITCTYDGSQCGEIELCASTCPLPPEEITCDGIDNDCDPETPDDNCPEGESCDLETGECVSDSGNISNAHDDAIVLIHPDHFINITARLSEQNRLNDFFFRDQTEEDAEDAMANILAGIKSAVETYNDATGFPIMLMSDYREITEIISITEVTFFERIGIIGSSDEILIIYEEGVTIDQTFIEETTRHKNQLKNTLEIAGIFIDAGLAIDYGLSNAPDGLRLVVYTFTEFFLQHNPLMETVSFLKLTRDTAFAIFQIDKDQLSCNLTVPQVTQGTFSQLECGVWLVSNMIDIFDSLDVSDFWDGECGLLNGEMLTCISTLEEGLDILMHPLPIIEEIRTIRQNNRYIFVVNMRNYRVLENLPPEFTDGLWVGATVMADDYIGCNYDLPPQFIHFDEEEENVQFIWDIPEDAPRDQPLILKTKLWYNCALCNTIFPPEECNNYPYEQCNQDSTPYVCYGDELEQLEIALSAASKSVTIDSVICESNSECGSVRHLGAFCGKDGNLHERLYEPLCMNAGETNSFCSARNRSILEEYCPFGCLGRYCLKNPAPCQEDSDCGIPVKKGNFCGKDNNLYLKIEVPYCDTTLSEKEGTCKVRNEYNFLQECSRYCIRNSCI